MFLFPLIYFSSFLVAVKQLLQGNKQAVLLFIIFGLPIYTTSLSILFLLGFRDVISFLQPFKELMIVSVLGIGIWKLNTRIRLHLVDYAIIAYFAYTFLYVLLPVGEYGFAEKLMAFKSTSFFALIYFAGRLFNPAEIYINKYFHYILLVCIAAAIIVVSEVLLNRHLQTVTGYGDYNFYFFNQEPTGDYGLTWTFELETGGMKRFGSFFSDPLEHAAATVLALAIIAGLYTNDKNQFKPDLFGLIALAATFVSIVFALSRASMVSYFMVIYVYAFLTRKNVLLYIFHTGFIVGVIYFFFLLENDKLYDYIIETLTFQNASSIGHIIEWVDGINAMIKSPLGLGLGSSGRVSGETGDNVGGENTFIITGVQAGIVALLLYLFVQIALIRYPYRWYKSLRGKERKVALALLLLKTGSIISLLTTNLEAHSYVNYLSWFFSGLFISIITRRSATEDQKPRIAAVTENYER